jgi:hypothetical protein
VSRAQDVMNSSRKDTLREKYFRDEDPSFVILQSLVSMAIFFPAMALKV